jgi:hypothetical protein
VDHGGTVDLPHGPAGQPQAQAEVRVFHVHEEPWVEAAHGVERGAAGEQAHAGQPVGCVGRGRRTVAQRAHRQLQRCHQPARRIGRAAVGLDDARREQRIAGPRRGQQRAERIVLETQIGIQDREPLGVAPAERLVVVGAVAERPRIAQHLHLAARQRHRRRVGLVDVQRQHQAPHAGRLQPLQVGQQQRDEVALAVTDDRQREPGPPYRLARLVHGPSRRRPAQNRVAPTPVNAR